jgi:hypothetical protein
MREHGIILGVLNPWLGAMTRRRRERELIFEIGLVSLFVAQPRAIIALAQAKEEELS